ncbi:MAG: hypothetical protein U0M13_00645, partial [Desulfovibrio fairfieldensis]|nr:hypothetical protein [Desulfovibrio fairfieldensis]
MRGLARSGPVLFTDLFAPSGIRQGALFFQAETMRAAFSFFTFPPHATHGLHEQLGFFGIQCGIIHVILRCPRVHSLFSPPFLRLQGAFFRRGGFFSVGKILEIQSAERIFRKNII